MATSVGIDEFKAGALPEDKKTLIDQLHTTGAIVAMAGDGVNDAPALAAAEVGLAMGTGADVAVESAGITLLNGDLTGIVRARKLAKAQYETSARTSSWPSSTTLPVSPSPLASSTRSPEHSSPP